MNPKFLSLAWASCLNSRAIYPVAYSSSPPEYLNAHKAWLWCWRRLLRVPWTARRSNQSILKISPGCSLEGMKLKLSTLATSCEGLTHWKRLWCWEGLGAGGEGDNRGWDSWMHHWFNGCESEWTARVGDGQGGLACHDSRGHKESDTTEWLDWSELRARSLVV